MSRPSFLDRWPRRTRMIGGPLDGDEKPLPLPDGMAEPEWTCYRLAGGVWQHYARTGESTYTHVGECAGVDHDGADPHDHRPCDAPLATGG